MWLIKLGIYVVATNIALWASVYGVIELLKAYPLVGIPACALLMTAFVSMCSDIKALPTWRD